MKWNERHQLILKTHSEQLKDKYEENFNGAMNFYKAEIQSLKLQLVEEKQKLLISHKDKPLYSPRRYAASSDPDNGQLLDYLTIFVLYFWNINIVIGALSLNL